VCNALNSGAPDPNSYHESNADYVAKQIGGRAYTAYLKSGTLAKDSASWKGPVQGHSKGVVTYILSGNGNDNCGGKVNDYTALPSEWENGKKFETEEPRSYGGTSRWFNSLDAAKRAVEQAVEKDQAYWAKKGAKDRVPQDCLDLGALAL
jgi:hypothetical protein